MNYYEPSFVIYYRKVKCRGDVRSSVFLISIGKVTYTKIDEEQRLAAKKPSESCFVHKRRGSMKIIIFSNGQIDHYNFVNNKITQYDLMICCDGGVRHTKALNRVPDYIIGDLDSSPKAIIEYYKSLNVDFKVFPTKKDETDTEIGIDFAITLGATHIDLYGATGNRFDHTLANIHTLMKALKAGVIARIIDEHNCIELIDKSIELTGAAGDIVSLIPLSTVVSSVCTFGLEYPLNHEDLKIGSSRGISNVMIGGTARITIDSGYLIVIKACD